jgi:hypothetical protein
MILVVNNTQKLDLFQTVATRRIVEFLRDTVKVPHMLVTGLDAARRCGITHTHLIKRCISTHALDQAMHRNSFMLLSVVHIDALDTLPCDRSLRAGGVIDPAGSSRTIDHLTQSRVHSSVSTQARAVQTFVMRAWLPAHALCDRLIHTRSHGFIMHLFASH